MKRFIASLIIASSLFTAVASYGLVFCRATNLRGMTFTAQRCGFNNTRQVALSRCYASAPRAQCRVSCHYIPGTHC